MSKIVFKTTDNIVYIGDLEYLGQEDFIVKNIEDNGNVPKDQWIRLTDNPEEKYKGRVTFRIDQVIWYYQK